MSKQKTYIAFIFLSLAGYIWLYLNYIQIVGRDSKSTHCLFKYVTGIPCPSCGVTRSVVCLLHLNIKDALLLNPLGVIVLIALFFCPVFIIGDLLFKKNFFLQTYQYIEKTFQKRWVAIPSILIVLFIWINNINNKI